MPLKRSLSHPILQDIFGIILVFLIFLPLYWTGDVLRFYAPAVRWLEGLSIYQVDLNSSLPRMDSAYYPFPVYLQALFVLPFWLTDLSKRAEEVALPLGFWDVLAVKWLRLAAHLLVYVLVLVIQRGWSRKIRWNFAFNPLMILISFIMGWSDELVVPLLLAILILNSRIPTFWTSAGIGLFLGLAASIKVWPVLLLPWLLIENKGKSSQMIALAVGFLGAIVINLFYFLQAPEGLSVLLSDVTPIGLRYPWKIRGTNPLLIHPTLTGLYRLPLFKFALQGMVAIIPLVWYRRLRLLDAMIFVAGLSPLLMPEVADYRFLPCVSLLALRSTSDRGEQYDVNLQSLFTILNMLVIIGNAGYFWLFYPYLQSVFESPLNYPLATPELAQKLYPIIENLRAWIGMALLISLILWFRAVIKIDKNQDKL